MHGQDRQTIFFIRPCLLLTFRCSFLLSARLMLLVVMKKEEVLGFVCLVVFLVCCENRLCTQKEREEEGSRRVSAGGLWYSLVGPGIGLQPSLDLIMRRWTRRDC